MAAMARITIGHVAAGTNVADHGTDMNTYAMHIRPSADTVVTYAIKRERGVRSFLPTPPSRDCGINST
jgi:hypothetical protein